MIKDPTGDSMSKAPNLVDLFANRKDAQAKAGHHADARKAAPGRGFRSESLPLEPAGKKSEAGGNPSFQARIKESRAKLASGSHKFFDQGKAQDTRRNESASASDSRSGAKSAEARAVARESSEGTRVNHAERNEEARSLRKPARPGEDSSGAQGQKGTNDPGIASGRRSGSGSGKASQGPDEKGPADAASLSTDGTGLAAQGTSDSGNVAQPIQSEETIEELKSGLESLGITVTREQLDNPVFLADMLEMLQNLAGLPAMEVAASAALPGGKEEGSVQGMPQPPAPGFQAVEAEKAVADPASPALAAQAPLAVAQKENPETDPKPSPEGVPQEEAGILSRKEAAALIRDRISELTRNPSDDPGNLSGRAANAPAPTSGVWQGVALRPQGESLGTDPLPMADLDRLRVLQASALQSGATGRENTATLALESDAEAADTSEEGGISHLPPAEASDAAEGDADPGPYGRKEDGFKNPDLAVRKDVSASPKDGTPGPQFTQALDLARAPEHRSAVQRAWSPHQPAFEKSVLDQISRKASVNGLKSGEELSIQLAPENLGKVRISLELKEGVMSARIGVENEGVRQVVEANLAGLRESLEAQGVKLQGLDVSVDQRHGSLFNPDGSNAESFFRRQGRETGGGADARETAPFESAPESDTGRRLGYNTMEYIG